MSIWRRISYFVFRAKNDNIVTIMYKFRWFWQLFGDFSQLHFFFTLVQKRFGPKINFWRFLKKSIFSQKSDYLNRFPREVSFLKMSTFIYFTFLDFDLGQKLFFKTLQNCEGGTILSNFNFKIKYSFFPVKHPSV